jgi:hypothetical protein
LNDTTIAAQSREGEKNVDETGVARWHIFTPKIPNLIDIFWETLE